MEKCKVAFIGAGYMAREHLKAFADVPQVEIVGIHSRTRALAVDLANEMGVPKVFDSVKELYEGTQADLVVITVTELSMNKISQECFKFPWFLLLEKPAGYNVSDAEEILSSAKENNSDVFVALNRRFLSSTRTVYQDLADCKGKRFIRVQDQQNKERALASGQPKLVVDNWMFANSIHAIDYLRFFGRGKIKRVKPTVAWNPDSPGVVVSSIEFESGDIGLYEGIWEGPGPWAVSINTPEKLWEMRPLEKAKIQLVGEREQKEVQINKWDKIFKPGLRLMAEETIRAVQGYSHHMPTLSESLETMRLIDAIFNPNIRE
jgi:predicted dehydrogenase